MALPDSQKLTIGTLIVVADSTDHGPAAGNDLGTRTDQIDCTSLAAGAARQSAKLDFTANLDLEINFGAAIEMATAPTAGELVSFFIAWSPSATAANANPGGIGGTDSAYTGYSSNLDNSLRQLHRIGQMFMTVQFTGTVQIDTAICTFRPRQRYGTLVVYNETSDAFHSDMVETSFVFTPLVHQTQD